MFLDPKGGDAKLLAQKLKEANIQIERRKQARKALAEVDAIGESNPSPIDISDEEGSDGEGVVEAQTRAASYEKQVAAAAAAVAAGSKEPIEDIKCSICDECFTRVDNFNRHIQNLHTPVEGGVPCTRKYCKLDFETKYDMLIHRDGSDGKKGCTYECPACPFKSSRNDRVVEHQKQHSIVKKVNDWRGLKK